MDEYEAQIEAWNEANVVPDGVLAGLLNAPANRIRGAAVSSTPTHGLSESEALELSRRHCYFLSAIGANAY